MIKNIILLLFAFSSLLITDASVALAQAGEQVGSVIAVRGKVIAFDTKGVTRDLSLKSPIFGKDTIKTGPQGRIQVLFSDNTIISLGKESRMEITEHFWKPDQKTGAMKTKVKEGVFRVMGGAIAKDSPESFTTETPAATIGIRGSMYAGRVGQGTLDVVFEGGKGIYVMNDAGQVSINRPGFGTHIRSVGNPPEKPKRISTQVVSGLNNDLSVSDQAEEEETTAPAQEGGDETTAPAQEGDDGASSPAQEGEIAPADQDQTDESSTGDQPSENNDQTSSDAGTGSGEQNQTGQEGDTGAGLSTFSSINASPTDYTAAPIEAPIEPFPITTPYLDPKEVIPVPDPIQEIPGIPEIPGISMSGESMSALADMDDYWNSNNNVFYSESLTATSSAGLIECSLTAPDSTVHTFTFSIASYNPGGTYSPSAVQVSSGPYTINLLGADRTFTWKISSDPLGEFAFYETLGSFTQTATYEYAELGYMGVPSTSTPLTDGIDFYKGRGLGFEIIGPVPSTARKDFGAGNAAMEVNWLNGKAIGVMDFDSDGASDPAMSDSKGLLYFFGTVDRTTGALTDVRFLGDRGPEEADPTGPVAWIEGSTFSGQFYGSDNQGFGFMGTGNDYDVNSAMTTRVGTSRLEGAMFRDVQDPTDATSPTGSATFSGFVVGVAERMSNLTIARRRFMNTDANDFGLSINREMGTVAGTLSAFDAMYPPDIFLSNIEIGSSHGSAYVLDDNFAALLGDTGNDSVNVFATAGGLKPYASYLVTAKPDEQINEYVTWGYWEIAYFDPTSPDPSNPESYHVHQPGAFWIAGERTSPTVIQSMVTNSFTGQYIGTAHGVQFTSTTPLQPLTNGMTNITVDFDLSATNPVSGTIQFDQVTFNLLGGNVYSTSSQFFADTFIGAIDAGDAHGAFYGPNANAVGGNFKAEDGGVTYMGVFGGARLP